MADENEIQRETHFVTCADNRIMSVTKHFAAHCYQYEKELLSISEILTVSEHIETE